MEALIVAAAVLFAIVLIDAGYRIAVSLARWSPVIAVGGVAGWLAQQHGAQSLEALGIAFLASIAARPLMRPRLSYRDDC